MDTAALPGTAPPEVVSSLAAGMEALQQQQKQQQQAQQAWQMQLHAPRQAAGAGAAGGQGASLAGHKRSSSEQPALQLGPLPARLPVQLLGPGRMRAEAGEVSPPSAERRSNRACRGVAALQVEHAETPLPQACDARAQACQRHLPTAGVPHDAGPLPALPWQAAASSAGDPSELLALVAKRARLLADAASAALAALPQGQPPDGAAGAAQPQRPRE